MTRSFRIVATVFVCTFSGFAAAAAAHAAGITGAQPRHDVAASTASATPASPGERGELTRKFVLKWGAYVQKVYGVEVGVWARRMVPTFVAADALNFRNALRRDTFEGAMAELTGSGHRLSDARAIDAMAKVPAAQASLKPAAIRKALGDLARDLVYTPLTPCRIVDTRNTSEGMIPATGSRSFTAIGLPNYGSQGGNAASDCGTAGVAASAVVVNVTAVTPSIPGYATVYPFGATQPLAASVNYRAGDIINNSVVVRIPNPQSSFDFTIFSYAFSEYVVDIVGYFAPPQATELQCTTVQASVAVAANEPFNLDVPNCPSGYSLTGAGCRTPGFNQANWAINGLYPINNTVDAFCSGLNITAGPITVDGVARCCRVPGR